MNEPASPNDAVSPATPTPVVIPKSVQRKLDEGRGSGTGASYKPWFRAHEFPSEGRITRRMGVKTGREHTLFSSHEGEYCTILDECPNVIDIRENFPLPLQETCRIADELGMKHPFAGELVVVTTDFLVTLTNGDFLARSFKRSEKLSDTRTLEKLQIERQYWKRRNIDWGLVTEREIDLTLSKSLSDLGKYHDIEKRGISTQVLVKARTYLERHIMSSAHLAELGMACDEALGLESGSGLSIIKHLIILRKWSIDWTIPFDARSSEVCTSISFKHHESHSSAS